MTALDAERFDGRRSGRGGLRSWAPWMVLVVIAGATLAFGLHGGGGRPTLDAQVQHIGSLVRCPVCNGETVSQSEAAPSVAIRQQIRSDLQKGQSQGQILSSLVASYGPGILEKPQAQGISVLVWVVPVIALLVGAVGVVVVVRRWRSVTPVAVAGPAPPTLRSRLEGPDAGAPEAGAPEAGAPEAGAPESGDAAGKSEVGESGGGGGTAAPPTSGGPTARPARSRRARLVVAGAGLILVAGGASWAVVASSGTRLPGQPITGQSLTSQTLVADIVAATADEDRNDPVGALKLYQTVLQAEPNQVEALAGEGWLLAQTGQPALLQQGLGLLVRAEQAQPSYGPAHLYRGLAMLGEGDYSGAVAEFQWYLGHNPDPKLVSSVKGALARAQQSGSAATAPTTPTTAASKGTAAVVPTTTP